MENNELNEVVTEEETILEIDESKSSVEQPMEDVAPPAISELDSTLRDGEMRAMSNEEAFNRDLYNNMNSQMNQPSPLYDDEYEVGRMLEQTNEESRENKNIAL